MPYFVWIGKAQAQEILIALTQYARRDKGR